MRLCAVVGCGNGTYQPRRFQPSCINFKKRKSGTCPNKNMEQKKDFDDATVPNLSSYAFPTDKKDPWLDKTVLAHRLPTLGFASCLLHYNH